MPATKPALGSDPFTVMRVVLPVSQKSFCYAESARLGLSTPSAYVRRLITAVQESHSPATSARKAKPSAPPPRARAAARATDPTRARTSTGSTPRASTAAQARAPRRPVKDPARRAGRRNRSALSSS